MTTEFLRNSSRIGIIRILVARVRIPSDQYKILQKLGDHGILVKFQRDLVQNSSQDLNDHGILQGILMATEFL